MCSMRSSGNGAACWWKRHTASAMPSKEAIEKQPKNIVPSAFFSGDENLFEKFVCGSFDAHGICRRHTAISTYRLHRVNIHHLIYSTSYLSCGYFQFTYWIEKKGIDAKRPKGEQKKEKLKIFIKLYQKPINFYPKWHFTIFRRHGARLQKTKLELTRERGLPFVSTGQHVDSLVLFAYLLWKYAWEKPNKKNQSLSITFKWVMYTRSIVFCECDWFVCLHVPTWITHNSPQHVQFGIASNM